MYCGKRADTVEHILGTAIVDEITRDPRGLPLPMTLNLATRDGPVTRSVPGKRTKQGATRLSSRRRHAASAITDG
jgi:hypothetical protein